MDLLRWSELGVPTSGPSALPSGHAGLPTGRQQPTVGEATLPKLPARLDLKCDKTAVAKPLIKRPMPKLPRKAESSLKCDKIVVAEYN